LPLRFERSSQPAESFDARGDGYAVRIDATGASILLRAGTTEQGAASPVRLSLVGASDPGRALLQEPLSGTSNYFLGSDRSAWRTGVVAHGRVLYEQVYPGIDLVYYGNQRRLEHDFVVAAGADPSAIALQVEGARITGVRADGALALSVGEQAEPLILEAPVLYQQAGDGGREAVEGRYVVDGQRIAFAVGSYDASRPLVIDPVLSYGTYLGGTGAEQGQSIATDTAGNVYIVGTTISADFPTTGSCPDCENKANAPVANDAFVAKIDPAAAGAASLVYAAYLGGNDNDVLLAVAVDTTGAAYVAGRAESTNYPTSNNPLQGSLDGGDEDFNGIVSKISPAGTQLVYSTYLGGARSECKGIAVNAAGQAVVVGSTTAPVGKFPVNGGFQTTPAGGALIPEAFITVLTADATGAVASSYLGGSLSDEAFGVALDAAGDAYVAGRAISQDFPTTAGVIAPAKNPNNTFTNNGFVTKVDVNAAAGTLSIVWSTYIPGGEIVGLGIDLDGSGSVYVGGSINFASGFVTVNPVQATAQGGQDGFVVKLNSTGTTRQYATYLGGSGIDSVNGIAVDGSGSAHVVGTTTSGNLPLVRPFQPAYGGTGDAFVSKLSATGSSLVYSTYVGGAQDDQGRGIALGGPGQAYMVGISSSTAFPTTAGAAQPARAGSSDAVVAGLFDTIGTACTTNGQCDDGESCNGVETCDVQRWQRMHRRRVRARRRRMHESSQHALVQRWRRVQRARDLRRWQLQPGNGAELRRRQRLYDRRV